MLLELCPPTGTTSFRLVLAFADLAHGLPNPPSWTHQLSALLQHELDLPRTMHMLDRAVGVGALLDTVRVSILQSDQGALGVRVHCRLVDGRTVEWCVHPGQERPHQDEEEEEEKRRLIRVLENILRDIDCMKEQDEKCKLAVQFEEQQKELRFQQQQQHRRHATTSSVPAFDSTRKHHKRQKSFLHSIVSAVGSMITNSNRSSSASSSNRPILPTTNSDYPFPRTPSPSPSPSPSPPLSLSSCIPQHGHGAPSSAYYSPNGYAYTSTPLVPWSPTTSTFSSPSFPSSPDSASFLVPTSPIPLPQPGSSAHHQALLRFHRERVRTGLVDMYRRFVMGVLVFGFAEEIGLVSPSDSGLRQLLDTDTEEEDDSATATLLSSTSTITHHRPRPSTSPAKRSTITRPYVSNLPSASPSTSVRSSVISPLTFDYRLWVIRSMLRRAESEVKEVVETVEREVRAELELEMQREREMELERERERERQRQEQEQQELAASRLTQPKSPTSPSSLSSRFGSGKRKVSFETKKASSPTKSLRNGSSGTDELAVPASGIPTLTKKKSKGKLVKKRSASVLVPSSGSKEGNEGSLLAKKKSWSSLKEEKEKPEKDGKEKETPFQRKLSLIGSWGRGNSTKASSSPSSSKQATSAPPPPISIPPSTLPPPAEGEEQSFSPTTMDVPQSFSDEEDEIDIEGEGGQVLIAHDSVEVSFIVHPPLPETLQIHGDTQDPEQEEDENDNDDVNTTSACGGSTESSSSTASSSTSRSTAVSYTGTTETRLTTPTPGSELPSRCPSALDGDGGVDDSEERQEQGPPVVIDGDVDSLVISEDELGGKRPSPVDRVPEEELQSQLLEHEQEEEEREESEIFQDVPLTDGPDKAFPQVRVQSPAVPRGLVPPRVRVFVEPSAPASSSSSLSPFDSSTTPPALPPKEPIRVFSRAHENHPDGYLATDARKSAGVPFSPTSPTTFDNIPSYSEAEDQLNLNINANLTIRLNLHPSYTRLTHLVIRLRSMLDAAERDRGELREEEERRLMEIEVRSRRRAWSNGVLGKSTLGRKSRSSPLRANAASGSLGVNWNNTVTLLALSIPSTSSPLAWGTSWTAEDGEREGWVYVVPVHPHPLFHSPYLTRGAGSSSLMREFPRVGVPTGPGGGSEDGMMMVRRVDTMMKSTMRRRMVTTPTSGVNAFGERVVDDREFDEFDDDDGGVYASSTPANTAQDACAMEFRLDTSWNEGTLSDDDEDDGELEELGLDDDDDRVFRAQYTSPPTSPGLGRPSSSSMSTAFAASKIPRRRKSSNALVTTTARSVFDDPDSDDEEEELGQLEFAHHAAGDHDLSNIPPRPRMRPTKNHPPPARLFVVAEEDDDDIDEQDEQVEMGGRMGMKSATSIVSLATTTTDGETETEGEGTTGDEFEFDRIGSVASKTLSQPQDNQVVRDNSGTVEAEDDDDDDADFFAEIHDITDIVGDIEDGFGRRGYAYGRGQTRHPRTSHPSNSTSPPGEADPSLNRENGGYPYDSFDVDVEMGLGAGEGLPGASSAEETELQHAEEFDGQERSKRRKSLRKTKSKTKGRSHSNEKKESRESKKEKRRRAVKARPKTPYPSDCDFDEAEREEKEGRADDGRVEYIEFAASPSSSSSSQVPVKRARNHKRQWQTMLGSSHIPADETSSGIEIKLDVERPKPRFMPAMKRAILGGGGKGASKPHQPRTGNSSTTSTSSGDSIAMYHGGKPRARTSSMYHRQSSPHSKESPMLASHDDDGDEEQIEDVTDPLGRARPSSTQSSVPPAGLGLPLGIGFGYGSYSNAPSAKPLPVVDSTPADRQLLETSLLCQPVQFAPQSPLQKPEPSTRLQTKSLVASPPVFTAPHEAMPEQRKHVRSVDHLNLDLETVADGVYDLASSDSSLSPHSNSSSDCCSSASLPMSPLSPSSPSPSQNVPVPESPVLTQARCAMDLDRDAQSGNWSVGPVQFTVGSWESAPSLSSSSSSTLVDGGEEFTLAMDVKPHHRSAQHTNNGGKKYFHLPSSLSLSMTDDEAENIEPVSSTVVVEKKMRTSRKSVLTDPAFFEPLPPVVATEQADLGMCHA